jgi:RNA polymerase sigma-70 factor (ECF subfamily)
VDSAEIDCLMARLAEGDRSAFAGVFRELWPRLRAFCVSLLRNPQDAEDAAQQAMEKVLTRAGEYDVTRPALPWALAIAAWECRTVARRRERRREVLDDNVVVNPGTAAVTHTVEDVFLHRELQHAALSAMAELSDADRAALVAAYWEQAQSGAPSARKRRQRAIERLRLAFARLYESG